LAFGLRQFPLRVNLIDPAALKGSVLGSHAHGHWNVLGFALGGSSTNIRFHRLVMMGLGAIWKTLLVVAGAIVVIGGALGYLAKFTGWGRDRVTWLWDRLRRRPTIPRTRLIIQPQPLMCLWSEASANDEDAVGFDGLCTMTSLNHEVQVVTVALEGVPADVVWNSGFKVGRI
jgi:hypothetical protein